MSAAGPNNGAHVRIGMSFEDLNERQIAARVGLLENMVEIPDGLIARGRGGPNGAWAARD